MGPQLSKFGFRFRRRVQESSLRGTIFEWTMRTLFFFVLMALWVLFGTVIYFTAKAFGIPNVGHQIAIRLGFSDDIVAFIPVVTGCVLMPLVLSVSTLGWILSANKVNNGKKLYREYQFVHSKLFTAYKLTLESRRNLVGQGVLIDFDPSTRNEKTFPLEWVHWVTATPEVLIIAVPEFTREIQVQHVWRGEDGRVVMARPNAHMKIYDVLLGKRYRCNNGFTTENDADFDELVFTFQVASPKYNTIRAILSAIKFTLIPWVSERHKT